MYFGPEEFNNIVENPNGKALKPRLRTEDSTIVIENFQNLVYHGGMNNTEQLQLGGTNMAYIEVSAYTDAELEGVELLLEVGALLSDGSMEYAPMGYFTVQRVEKDGDVSTFTALDRMHRFDKPYETSSITYPNSIMGLAYDVIVKGAGFTNFDPSRLPQNHTIQESLAGKGYTYRDMLGFIMGAEARFAWINRSGEFAFSQIMQSLRISKSANLAWEFEKADNDYAIGYIKMQKDVSETFLSGTKEGNVGLSQVNPLASQSVCDYVYNQLVGTIFRPCSVEMLDDIRIDPNDVVSFTDIDGSVYEFPCMQLVHNFTEVYTRVSATGDTELTDTYENKGSVSKAIEQTNYRLSIVKKDVETNAQGIVTVTEKTAEIEADIDGIEADFAEKIQETKSYADDVANTAERNANNATDEKLKSYSTTTEMNTAIDVSASGIRAEVSKSVENLQQQIDGAIETFTGSVVPTLENTPASDWTDNTERDKHIGDLYVVNADGGDYAGFYYRFEKSGTAYQWTLLKDTEVTKALQDAKEANEKAQAVADDLSANYSTTTQMNSAITQKADEITSSVSKTYTTKTEFANLEVGGRNITLNTTKMFDGVKSGQIGSTTNLGVIEAPETPSGYAARFLYKARASGNVGMYYTYATLLSGDLTKLVEGETYTVSFWAKGSAEEIFSTAWIDGQTSVSRSGMNLTTEWQKYYITFRWTNTAKLTCVFYLYGTSEDITLYLSSFKLERGNKATDWTPAPEDVDADIAEAEANAIADTDNKLKSTGEANGSLITIEDATDDNIQDVYIYGKSTQDSTPTPDAPVDIVSVGDGGNTIVYARGRNLFDASRLATKTAGGATVTNNGDGSFTISGSGTMTSAFAHGYDYSLEEMGIITAGTYTLAVDGVSTYPLFGMQYRTASGTATSLIVSNSALTGSVGGTFTVTQTMIDDGYRLRFLFYAKSGAEITGGTFRPMCYKGADAVDYEAFVETTATITDNLPLRGLKVIYDYNHTDASGQTWDCDILKKYADGTGKHIQRIRYFEFDGSDDESWTAYNGYFRYAVTGLYVGGAGLCNICPVETGTFSSNGIYYNAGFIYFRYDDLSVNGTDMTVADFKTWLSEHPMKLLVRLATPIETDLTADQVSAFEDLMSYKDCTNVFTDEGADLKVTYIRDTPLADTVSRVSKSESKITQLADEIELKVDKDGVISAINLSPEVVKILAKYIQLEGIVTANGYFKILEDGSMEAVNGTFISYPTDSVTGKAELKDGKLKLQTSKEERTDYDDGGYMIADKDYIITIDSVKGRIEVAESVTETTYDSSGNALTANSYSQAWTPIDFTLNEANFDSLVVGGHADITELYAENIRVKGDAYSIVATANTTTLLADFAEYENGGIYEVLVWNDNHTEYFTACKSPASVALSSVTRSTTLSLATSSTGQYTVGIKNSSSVEHIVNVRVIKKNY